MNSQAVGRGDMTVQIEERPGVETSQTPRYARFSRRLRAFLIDWIIALVLFFGGMSVAISLGSDAVSRALGIAIVAVLVLYEPVLVSRIGGTLGHIYANLRVVDQSHGGNLGFARALGRFVVKSLLGWYSFLVMTATRRNQAVHDLVTRSTVQIRDPAKALPHHYITERTDFRNPGMPSRLRRVAVICCYLLLAFVAFGVVLAVASAAGALSSRCLHDNGCPGEQGLLLLALALIWLAASAAFIGLGWRGRLLGARRS
jgi:uncharacterized RDD family membrane protein YckC